MFGVSYFLDDLIIISFGTLLYQYVTVSKRLFIASTYVFIYNNYFILHQHSFFFNSHINVIKILYIHNVVLITVLCSESSSAIDTYVCIHNDVCRYLCTYLFYIVLT